MVNDYIKLAVVIVGAVALYYLYTTYIVKNDGDMVSDTEMPLQLEETDVEELEEKRTKPTLDAEDLLPQDKNGEWAKVNPEGKGSIAFKNFLEAGYHIGVNTVGQSLRNANQSIRSEPPNPREVVSPWSQSTIEYDTNRKPLEIGGCE